MSLKNIEISLLEGNVRKQLTVVASLEEGLFTGPTEGIFSFELCL